ncbi:unnamed protein product, partial [Didymodactylos carnosus]
PAIARPSSLQRGHRRLVIDAVCGCDDLDLAVLLVLVLLPGYVDALVVAENVDLPFVGIESGVPVVDVDVVLSVPIFVVLAFVVVSVDLFAVASEFRLSTDRRSITAGFESYLAYYDPSEAGLL